MSKSKSRALLKDKIDYTLENVELNFEADEKLVIDTWQQASSAISHMVSSTCYYISFQEYPFSKYQRC